MARRPLHFALAVLLGATLPLGAFVFTRLPAPTSLMPTIGVVQRAVQERFLMERVRYLTEDIGERNHLHPLRLETTAAYIHAAFQAMGYAPTSQYYAVKEQTYRNVFARREGTGPTLVVGAHFDSAPGTKGADDNASAVAVLLEMARFARQLPPGRAMEFVAFTNEEALEFGIRGMGSYQYVKHARKTGKAIGGMICLEMLGYYSDADRSQDYPGFLKWFFPSRGNFVALVSDWRSRTHMKQLREPMKISGFEVRSAVLPRATPGVDFSDHENFWNAGIPAVLVTDTAFYRNPHYHRQTDTWDTLNYSKMVRLSEALCAALKAMN